MCFMNKPKINESFLNKRLSSYNINNYLQDTYGQLKFLKEKILNITSFLQKNYGKDGDCTLTSILTVTKFYKKELDDKEIYNYIEKIAEKYLYNGDSYGTIPLFNKSIINEVFKHFQISKKISTKYIKGIGFNAKTIINLIDSNIPVIISLTDDGRKYYKSHTITIVGYNIYEDVNQKQKIIFKVFDN